MSDDNSEKRDEGLEGRVEKLLKFAIILLSCQIYNLTQISQPQTALPTKAFLMLIFLLLFKSYLTSLFQTQLESEELEFSSR